MLALNQVLQDRYRITRQLGQGGMGAVYEAIDERFGEPVALKEIILELASEEQKEIVFRAFEREAKALAKAKHEVVPYVRDYFSEVGRQFLVMELVEGDDLGKMLEVRQAPFPLENVLKWMDQLLDALDYLHHLKPPIIHRDIKPQNLKLNLRGKIKLLDFGIARSSDHSATLTKQTFVGATLNYSPIEQLLRVIYPSFLEFILLKHKENAEEILSQDTDPRSDIYALGGTFYHLLTNQVPIDATKRILDVWEGKPDPLPNPAALNPDLPLAIAECLLKAMAVERKDRFSSALEMQETLKSVTSKINFDPPVKNHEKLAQTKTEVLVSDQNLRAEMPTEAFSVEQIEPSQATKVPVFETASAMNNAALAALAETISSVHVSNSDLTGPSYLQGILPEEKATSPNIPQLLVKEKSDPASRKSILTRVLPIGLFGFLAAGIGSAIWLGFLSTSASNKSVSNISLSSPTVIPTSAPTNLPNAAATVEPPPPAQQSRSETANQAARTPNKIPAPVKTPQIKGIPKPKQDPNCILTNSCR
jgi:serine/threonine protein kinase